MNLLHRHSLVELQIGRLARLSPESEGLYGTADDSPNDERQLDGQVPALQNIFIRTRPLGLQFGSFFLDAKGEHDWQGKARGMDMRDQL